MASDDNAARSAATNTMNAKICSLSPGRFATGRLAGALRYMSRLSPLSVYHAQDNTRSSHHRGAQVIFIFVWTTTQYAYCLMFVRFSSAGGLVVDFSSVSTDVLTVYGGHNHTH